jgi:hypothetical protein
MQNLSTYYIRVRGQVEEEDINAASPLRLTVKQVEDAIALITVQADQSGMIGLIRHLHGLGLLILSVNCI